MDAAFARSPFALKQDNQRIAEIALALCHQLLFASVYDVHAAIRNGIHAHP
jgi:hypothetical protein